MKADELKKLANSFGHKSSWAIWDDDNLKNTEIITQKADELQTHYVFIALNLSQNVESWANFHCGKNDWKLKSVLNHHPKLRGSYMTDLIFKVASQSSKIDNEYFANEGKAHDIKNQIEDFRKELNSLGVQPGCTFILFGKQVQNYFSFFIDEKFYSCKRIKLPHYSSRNGDWIKVVKEIIKKEIK